MAKEIDIQVTGVRELVAALRATPERLDKAMRAEFRTVAKETRDRARSNARSRHPSATTPKHKGEYRWSQVVNSIRSGADSDTPWVQFGGSNVPGWAGWEFGSDRHRQFPPRSAKEGRGNKGYFFFTAVLDEGRTAQKKAEEIVEKYRLETEP